VIGPTPNKECTLEPGGVEVGGAAEGADGSPDAEPLGEVHEEVRRPGVDQLVALRGHHLPVLPLVGIAHSPELLLMTRVRF
jgi:hypothetical protein